MQLDVGGTDVLLGESFSTIASRSRAMHKSQGFGNFGSGGAAAAAGRGRSRFSSWPANRLKRTSLTGSTCNGPACAAGQRSGNRSAR